MVIKRKFGMKKVKQSPEAFNIFKGGFHTPAKRSISPVVRRRRKKGEITKLKEKLWLLCRLITKQRYGNKCYTCGKEVPDGKGMHTGHYITSSLCSVPLRFDLRNLRPQCYHCNINLSGNWPNFQNRMEGVEPKITLTLMKLNYETKGIQYPAEWFISKIAEYQKIYDESIKA